MTAKKPAPKETAQTKVAWRGVYITARMRDQFRAAEKKVQARFPGVTLLPAQGSWNGTVNASGTTHHGAGVADIRTVMYKQPVIDAIVKALADVGLLPYERKYNWDGHKGGQHLHVLDSVTTGMSPSAKWQVAEYHARRNGLNNHAADRSYRPKVARKWSYPLKRIVLGR